MRCHAAPEFRKLVRPLKRRVELNEALGVHPRVVALAVVVGLQHFGPLNNPRVYAVPAGFCANSAVIRQTVGRILDGVRIEIVDFPHMVTPRAAVLFKAKHLRAVGAHRENRAREHLGNSVQQIVVPGAQGGLGNRHKRRCIDNFAGRILAGRGFVDFSEYRRNILKSHTNSHVYITSLCYLSAGG